MILYNERITKALIRLRECAGWSAPELFATPRRQIFSRRGPHYNQKQDLLIDLGIKIEDLKVNTIFNHFQNRCDTYPGVLQLRYIGY